MHISWEAIELVAAIAETGSLSAAARALRVTQPTASRRLAELEATLGEPLFVRGIAGTTPTELGERLLEPARRMAALAAEVEHAASDVDPSPRGVVRVSAAPGMAYLFVAPFAALLRERLPAIRLEVTSTVRYVDLVRREADVALRWQSPSRRDRPRDLVVVASVAHPVRAFAAPPYVATLPRAYGPADVAWIGWCPPLEQTPPNPQLAARIPGFVPAFGSDDFLVQLQAAEAGAGAIVLSRVRHHRAPPSRLVELALDLRAPPAQTQVVASRGALAIPRVAAVAELLARELEGTVAPPRRAARESTRARGR